jgi:hypothetical protein
VARLTLSWSSVASDECLRVGGFADRERDRLARADPDELARLLPVYAQEPGGRSASHLRARFPPMRGRYVIDGANVCFAPRFPFRPGTTYLLLVAPEVVPPTPNDRVDPDGFMELLIERPARSHRSPAQVVTVQPTARVLPRNHLRFYVTFCDPMCEGDATEHVHLRRLDTGEELQDVFLPFDPELWDVARRRLTVLLDPARIKQGLAPHRAVGYPLVEDVDVALVIDGGYRDAHGVPIAVPFSRQYRVGPDLRSLVVPERWIVDAPGAGTREPLVVHFDRPLDAALLARCLHVVDREGVPTPGVPAIGAEEQSWSFSPASAWKDVEHRIVVDAVLEDVAGNSVARVLDRDLADCTHTPRATDSVRIAFVPARTAPR